MDKFTVSSRQLERKFIREIEKKGYFQTLRGNINRLISKDREVLRIQTNKGKTYFEISRKKLRKAITFVFFKRTVVREDLQCFSNFTSALLGICYKVFEHIAKVQVLKYGLYRLSLLGVRFFASGLERDPAVMKLLPKVNGKFVLYNYYQLQRSKWIDNLETNDLYALIDSGAYSLYQEKLKEKKSSVSQINLFSEAELDCMTVEGYANFINRYKDNKRILGFFPLDVVGDPHKTKVNYKHLKELTNATIYPVWQIIDSMDSLEMLVKEEHAVIGIGGIVPYLSSRKADVRKILDQVFSKYPTVNFHFLGGANEMLLEYNWFSSDSTAFLNARKSSVQRKVYLDNGYRINAPDEMTTMEIIKQNLKFLFSLEEPKRYQTSINFELM